MTRSEAESSTRDQVAWFQLNQSQFPGVQVKAAAQGERLVIVGIRIERPEGLTNADLRSVPVARIAAMLNSGDTLGKLARQRTRLQPAPEPPPPPTKRQLRMSVPEKGRYPDAFYVALAMRYRALVANGIAPAQAIAEANGVPVTTVHRWIREARRRTVGGRPVLAPAQGKGQAG